MLAEMRYLPAFLAVCEERGFHRAAEKLHLTQPAVSYQIRSLEALLDVPLFDRTGRGATLTDAGKLLLDYCRRSLGDFAALRTELRAGAFSGTLRIASVSGFGRYVLYPFLANEFESRFELRFPTQDEVLRFVAAGVCDVGFVYEAKVSSALNCIPLCTEELVLIANRKVRLSDVSKLPFVTYDESEYVIGKWMLTHFKSQPTINSVAHFEELEEVVDYVRRDRGVSVVPDHCAGGVPRVRTRRTVRNQLFAVTRAGSSPNPSVERLIAALA